jgi:galactonate dehydratase
MRITETVTTVVGAPWRELTFVELHTDTGLVGVGEVRMVNKTDTLVACIEELTRRYVIGRDPFDVERLAYDWQWSDFGRPGEISQSALGAIDVACWDLMGQALGVPVWKLLGGCFRERIPAYANGWYQAERDPESIAILAQQVVERGYTALKIDPFGHAAAEIDSEELERSIAIIARVREAVGPNVQLMVELHGRFTASTAARVVRRLEPFEPEWIEEPVPPADARGLAEVRSRTHLPVATGERTHTLADMVSIVEGGGVDVIQCDLTHFGGLTGLRKLVGWAEARNLLLAPHNVCGPVGTAAAVHFAAAFACVKTVEHFNDFADPWVRELVDVAPVVDRADGCFSLPTEPGLGLRLDHETCAQHPRTGAVLRLFRPGWENRGEAVLDRPSATLQSPPS